MNTLDLSGLGVALATPFDADGAVDLEGFRRLTRHVLAGGTEFLVVLGSTGEAATLEEQERDPLIEACLEEAGGRPVLVGCGSSATAQAARWCARAQQLGAQGGLVVTPPYNKPMPHGLVAHYEACAAAAPDLALVAYNVPGRTGQNLKPATLDLLWANPNVIAVKESSGDLDQIAEIGRALPSGKQLLAGDDSFAVASIERGACGLISVTANILPAEIHTMVRAALAGDFEAARAHLADLESAMAAMFCESNPIPVKAGLAALDLAGDHLRLPLTPPQPATHERVRAMLAVRAKSSHQS